MVKRAGLSALLVLVVVLTLLDLLSTGVSRFFSNHQFVTAMLAEAILLLVVYAFIERLIETRQDKRWRQVAEPSLAEIKRAALSLEAIVNRHSADLPDRHAPHEEVAGAAAAVEGGLASFERVLTARRSLLSATPALSTYLVVAEDLLVDGRRFIQAMAWARGGVRASEWYEEAVYALYRTYGRFEGTYSDVDGASRGRLR